MTLIELIEYYTEQQKAVLSLEKKIRELEHYPHHTVIYDTVALNNVCGRFIGWCEKYGQWSEIEGIFAQFHGYHLVSDTVRFYRWRVMAPEGSELILPVDSFVFSHWRLGNIDYFPSDHAALSSLVFNFMVAEYSAHRIVISD